MLATASIAAAAQVISFYSIRHVAPKCTPSNTRFIASTRVGPSPNCISIGSAVFAKLAIATNTALYK